MTLLIDSRECHLKDFFEDSYFTKLEIGDIYISNPDCSIEFVIERKTVQDLFSSFKTDRYIKQKTNMKAYKESRKDSGKTIKLIYLLEGTLPEIIDDKHLRGFYLGNLIGNSFDIVLTKNIEETATFIRKTHAYVIGKVGRQLSYSTSIVKFENVKSFYGKRNMKTSSFLHITLKSIPGIGDSKAEPISREFNNSMEKFMKFMIDEHVNQTVILGGIIQNNGRKIGNVAGKKIVDYFKS